MDWNPDDRDRFLRQLDEAKRKVQIIYAVQTKLAERKKQQN